MTKSELRDKLRDTWIFDENLMNSRIYIAKEDFNALTEDTQELFTKKLNESPFITNVIPHPWWGNIVDPKIIVLAINPSYDPIADSVETIIFKDQQLKNIKMENLEMKDYLNWFKLDISKELNNHSNKLVLTIDNNMINLKINQMKYKSTRTWWNEVFTNHEVDIQKVGFFNMCGYHSKSYKWIKEYTKTKDYLPTQLALKDYLKELFKSKQLETIVFIWGKTTVWNALFNNKLNDYLNEKNCIVFNKDNKQNNIMTNDYYNKLKKYGIFTNNK